MRYGIFSGIRILLAHIKCVIIKFIVLQRKKIKLTQVQSPSLMLAVSGQPRDGITAASCCSYDTKKKLVEIKRIVYNIAVAQDKIRRAKLPEFLALRLNQGR